MAAQSPEAIIADLRWILTEPATLVAELRPFSALHKRLPAPTATWLTGLAKEPQQLLHYFAQTGANARLGRYFERLLGFYFTHAPGLDVALLASNVKVPGQLPTQTTLGELDFVLQQGNTVMHLEVAVKFYLGLPGNAGWQWLGPNARDQFAAKLARLCQHQLPVSANSAEYGSRITERAFLLQGALFFPWAVQPDAEAFADLPCTVHASVLNPCNNHSEAAHQWLYARQLPDFIAQHGSRYRHLAKHEWLSGYSNRVPTWLAQQTPIIRPQMYCADGVTPLRRLMVVPNHWPLQQA